VPRALSPRSAPFIYVDHDFSPPAIHSTPRTGRRRRPLDCWFRRLFRRVSIQRQPPPPDFVHSVALQTDYVPLRHVLPELERLINAFYSSLSPPFTRRLRIAYGTSAIHDPNDPASACGIDGLLKFPILPLPTPTRTSLVLFEPLLLLLTRRCLLPFILLFRGPSIAPRQSWPVPENLSHSGTWLADRRICRVDGVMFSRSVAQTIFIVVASERNDFVWFPFVVEERMPAEIEERLLS